MLGIFKSLSGPEFDEFLAVATRLSDDYDFGHTALETLVEKEDNLPIVRIYKNSESKVVNYDDKFQADSLRKWIENNAAPLLIDLDE